MTKPQPYTLAYFIKKFTATKRKQWCQWVFRNKMGQCCVYGLYGVGNNGIWTEEATALSNIFDEHNVNVSCVNDGGFKVMKVPKGFRVAVLHDHPRARILGVLHRIKELEAQPC